ncbi:MULTISPECIES: hypothetical protein [unclassified Mesorhizobium]|uniref:hypothetical protein n=1 Tax=unclassified Mesorhizobium TaxID=325217 RepID=UPI000BAFFD5C|nr:MULTISPECIES: hypothetical protein [unclassified Mesorhizobium]PBC21277.1 hypothetical protein CK226_20810 [Mesorhizobium sp. WSM4311]TRD04794.1 hypothetical protein FJV82_13130 [Mesorhizobium sp. WSM4305]
MRVLTLLLFIFLAVTPTGAAGIVIGDFCIDGATTQADSHQTIYMADGKWTRIVLKPSSQRGRDRFLVVFAAKPQMSGPVESCHALAGHEAAAGRPAFLAGQVEQLNVGGWIFEANTGTNRYYIDAGAFQAKLGRIESGVVPVSGGTSDLAGSKLWIANSKPILIDPSGVSGELEIEAWNRTIEHARLTVDGSDIADLTLASAHPGTENIVYRLDLKARQGCLWKGQLASKPIALEGNSLALDDIFLSNFKMSARSVRITAVAGAATVDLVEVAGASGEAGMRGNAASFSADRPTFDVARVTAAIAQSDHGFAASDFAFHTLKFATDRGGIASPSKESLLQGAVAGTVDSIAATGFQADLRFASPVSSILSMLTDAPGTADVRIARAADLIKVSGKLDTAALLFGKMQVEANQSMAFAESVMSANATAPTLEFPVSFAIPPASGAVKFLTDDHRVSLTGALKAFRLKGLLRVPLADIEASHLSVKVGDFELALGATAFLEPVIAGVVPTLSTADLAIASATDLTIGKASNGFLETSVGAMIVGEPILKIGEDGKKAKASLRLKTRAGADLLFDLATGRVLIARAELVAEDTHFHFLEPGAEIDLDGTHLVDPDVRFDLFEVSIARSATVEIAMARLVNLKAGASRLYKPANPDSPTEVSYSSTVVSPLSVGQARAARVDYKDSLSLEYLLIDDFSLAVANGDIRFGKDMRALDASISLNARRIERLGANDGEFVHLTAARIAADGKLDAQQNNRPHFAVELNAEGRADQLSGNGHISLGAFTGSKSGDLDMGFECDDGNKLKVPVEYNYGLGPTSLNLTADKGNFSASGSTGPFGLAFHTTSGRECHGPTKKWVVIPEQSGWTWGICGFPPKKCKWSWSTPEVNFKYDIKLAVRAAGATLFLSNPIVLLKQDEIKACNRGVAIMQPPPFVVGGYSPQIVSNFRDADNIINAFISASLEPAQTLFVAGLLQTVGQIAESVINVGQVICYG